MDRTTDLMKKGLRRTGLPLSAPGDDRTTDLMKKGLRPGVLRELRRVERQNDRPDEEGIKTLRGVRVCHYPRQNDRPDEEGIKTPAQARNPRPDATERQT